MVRVVGDPDVERCFGARSAVALAVFMPFAANAFCAFVVWGSRKSDIEGASLFLWWLTILVANKFLGPGGIRDCGRLKLATTVWSVAMFATSLANPLCMRGTGAIAGVILSAASLAVVTRAWQLFGLIETARRAGGDLEWTLAHRMYFMSAIAWHDADQLRAIPAKAIPQDTQKLLRSTAGWAAVAVPCAWLATATSGAELQWQGLASFGTTILHFSTSAVVALTGFFLTDLLIRLSHVVVNGIDMPSLMGKRLFHADTLAEFWREWNLPVQRLLYGSVYQRSRALGASSDVSKALCFAVSGACHAGPLLCGGVSATWAFSMMLFFMLQVPLLAIERTFHLRSKAYVYTLLMMLTPLFIRPLTCGFDLDAHAAAIGGGALASERADAHAANRTWFLSALLR